MIKKILLIASLCFLVFSTLQCGIFRKEFIIISGSENETLEPMLERFGRKHGVNIVMKYKGSVDMMLELAGETIPYDAVWPANSLWVSLGDKNRKVKHLKSIMTSPVVFGIRKSVAEKLGFVGRDVYVKDIAAAIQGEKLRFMMTSATQSNSGASAYFGFIYAILGNPEVVTKDDLYRPELKRDIRRLLSGINRSSGSSGWLKDLFLKGNYDAMVNYEALIIEANQELAKRGKESLHVVYPVDGIVMADSPLGYINKGDADKEKIFKELQEYLLSSGVQRDILKQGRRTGLGGVMGETDPSIFNPDWGIDTKKILSPVRLPSADVIYEALSLYQTEFRKPSYTVFCLDFSGSMGGDGVKQLKSAMELLLAQEKARQYLINAAREDVIVVIPFSGSVITQWKTVGNREALLNGLLAQIKKLNPAGGTDIYSPVIRGLELLKREKLDDYIPAIILLTDGESNVGRKFRDVEVAWTRLGIDVPVFSIMFGKASEDQLKQLAELTRGKVFDGRKDLIQAFRKVKGYN